MLTNNYPKIYLILAVKATKFNVQAIYFVVRCPLIIIWYGRQTNNKNEHQYYLYNTTVYFTCNTGHIMDFTPHGSANSTTCLASGQWSHQPPWCLFGKNNYLHIDEFTGRLVNL